MASNSTADSSKKSTKPRSRVFVLLLVILVILTVGLVTALGWPYFHNGETLLPLLTTKSAILQFAPTRSASAAPIPSTPTPPPQPAYVPGSADVTEIGKTGLIVLSMNDGEYTHLFAYHPLTYPFTRLTNNPWDDADPAISPDGKRIAFRSKRNGYWGIYILDLETNLMKRMDDSTAYEGAPSWSPDGHWLAYENYVDDNLEIFIRSIADLSQTPIRLTNDHGVDSSPAWSPSGRSIAFVSNRSGNEEIWLASLDQTDNRFKNVSRDADSNDRNPTWSPDGKHLAYTSEKSGISTLNVWNSQEPDSPPQPVGPGYRSVWSPDNSLLIAEIRGPNEVDLQGYRLSDFGLAFSAIRLSGKIHGMDWKSAGLPAAINRLNLPADARQPAPQLWKPALNLVPQPPNGRFGLVKLPDVTAPYPYLNDAVDEAFNALRPSVAKSAGWDFLATLENGYFPLTEQLTPGYQENWLLTGRAFATIPMPLYAGWMAIVREDFNGQTYWRMYIKARYQDGSQGEPLLDNPWDITARYTGEAKAYEEGGRTARIPPGYWVDFTDLASRFGWERLPSLNNWRTFFPSTRFNQYVITEGLDWNRAMNEVYPPEALVTVTYRPSSTPTVTETPEHFLDWTATPTYTPTLTSTLHPTWTPIP